MYLVVEVPRNRFKDFMQFHCLVVEKKKDFVKFEIMSWGQEFVLKSNTLNCLLNPDSNNYLAIYNFHDIENLNDVRDFLSEQFPHLKKVRIVSMSESGIMGWLNHLFSFSHSNKESE